MENNWPKWAADKKHYICRPCRNKQQFERPGREQRLEYHREYSRRKRLKKGKPSKLMLDPSGFVYVITNDAWPGWSKVGRATDVADRIRASFTWSPHRDYKLVAAAKFKNCLEAERRLHSLLAGFRREGSEWFRIHEDDARGMLVKLQEESI